MIHKGPEYAYLKLATVNVSSKGRTYQNTNIGVIDVGETLRQTVGYEFYDMPVWYWY